MWTQDKAYSALMRELWGSPERWNTRKTHAHVAAKLGVDEETVRNRLRRLKESGFLLGWRVVPNPALLGRESSMLLLEFDDQAAKEEAVPRLKLSEGVIVVASVYGEGLLVTFFDDPGHKASGQIARTKDPAGALHVGGMRFLPTDFRMTPTDWEIVRLMLDDAERGVSDVAREVKVSLRTVKRRLNRMMDSSAVSVMPMIDQSRSGGVSFTLMVECEDGRAAVVVGESIASRIGDVVFKANYAKYGLIFGFFAPNVAEGTEVQRWVRKLGGVRSARIHIVDEVVYVFDWLEKEARKRAAGAGKRGRPS